MALVCSLVRASSHHPTGRRRGTTLHFHPAVAAASASDEGGQTVTELGGVRRAEIDLVARPVEGEGDGFSSSVG
jgi:hypothetical protein